MFYHDTLIEVIHKITSIVHIQFIFNFIIKDTCEELEYPLKRGANQDIYIFKLRCEQ
jgi:hypothetical protein